MTRLAWKVQSKGAKRYPLDVRMLSLRQSLSLGRYAIFTTHVVMILGLCRALLERRVPKRRTIYGSPQSSCPATGAQQATGALVL